MSKLNAQRSLGGNLEKSTKKDAKWNLIRRKFQKKSEKSLSQVKIMKWLLLFPVFYKEAIDYK